jgi:Putative peptidoglycan binding domain
MNHTVVAGDSIPSLASAAGLFPDTVWNHPNNADLKKKRKNMNVLLPGDIVFIPDKQRKEQKVSMDRTHKFLRKGIPARFRIQLFDVETPHAGVHYVLEAGDARFEGKVTAQGVVEQWIPPDAEEGTLTLRVKGGDRVINLQFGQLDPLDEVVGIQKRMFNLGYLSDPYEKGELDEPTRTALKSFQRRFQLKETGEPDDPTRSLLDRYHDVSDQFDPDPWLTSEGS